jgi:ethanolamine utilization protein EutQ (cupin superfamily)
MKMQMQMDPGFYTHLMDTWKDYQETIQEQMNRVMKEQQSFVGDFSSRWLERSSKIGKQISTMSGGGAKEYQEIYTIWKNYQNKLNARIMNVTSIQNNGYSDLFEKWERSRTEMMSILMRMRDINEKEVDDSAPGDLYSNWLNVTNSVTNQITSAMAEGNVEYQKLTKLWFEFLDNMRVVISDIPKNNPHHEEIMGTWEKISMEMGSEISNLISESNKHLKTIQDSWREATNQIHKDLSKVFKDINYEELYSGFFDRTALPVFTKRPAKAVNSDVEAEMQKMKARIEELESQIEGMKKKKEE